MKTVIISAGDAVYFPLLKGLIISIHQQRPNAEIALGVLDVGLEPRQIEELRGLGVQVVAGQWDFNFAGREEIGRWFQAMTCRCQLPKYFPDFELLIWIDADAWLQDWRAIELLCRAAERERLAIVPELHRSYAHVYHMGDFNHDHLYDVYRMSFVDEHARFLAASPVINSGVFAMRHDSPTWQTWAKWMAITLRPNGAVPNKMSEQSALNAAFYFDRVAIVPLPAWCNWMCGQALPAFDGVAKKLVEPVIPYEPISIVHVSLDRTNPRNIRHGGSNWRGCRRDRFTRRCRRPPRRAPRHCERSPVPALRRGGEGGASMRGAGWDRDDVPGAA